jgi:hypothetical protein
MPSPIRIETVADLLAHHHTLGLYCHHCDRWSEAPLEQLAARGLDDRPIRRLNFRCVTCGTPALRQLRPPALSPASGGGWPAPLSLTAPADVPAAPAPPGPSPERPLASSARRRRQRRWMRPPWNNSVEHRGRFLLYVSNT